MNPVRWLMKCVIGPVLFYFGLLFFLTAFLADFKVNTQAAGLFGIILLAGTILMSSHCHQCDCEVVPDKNTENKSTETEPQKKEPPEKGGIIDTKA